MTCDIGCLDHFLENEVYENSWDSLYSILTDESLHGIMIDVGLPLLHRNCRYNARAIILNGKILCLRPKLYLANDGNFREMRFFTPWNRPRHVEQYYLPPRIQKHQGNRHVPIGDVVLSTIDTCVAAETCEELFTPNSPHINMFVNLENLNKHLSNLVIGDSMEWRFLPIAVEATTPSASWTNELLLYKKQPARTAESTFTPTSLDVTEIDCMWT